MMDKIKQAIRWARRVERRDGTPVADTEPDWTPNRAERRAYCHTHLTRAQRMYGAGFGRWRRFRYLTRGN